jgi:hypothetical protein
MATQLLIYERAVPVSSQKHGGWSVKTGADYSFAKGANSVPLLAAEFPNSTMDYAIVFAGEGSQVMPMCILGIQDGQNLYVGNDGSWQGRYIPAFLRRYPFVFSSNDDGKTFTLCIDEQFAGCNTDGVGERLFDSQGERTQYLQGVLGFLQAFQAQFQRTQAFCRKLVDLNLLDPMQAQFETASGQRMSLGGFSAVNREKLKALPGETLAQLAATDELELIYLHLQSMNNMNVTANRLGQALAAAGAGAPAAAPAAEETAPPAEDEPAPKKGRSKAKAGDDK